MKGTGIKVGPNLTDLNNAANGEVHSINADGSAIFANYKVVIRDDGNFRMGSSANIDPLTTIVMNWDSGNISTTGRVDAQNVTFRTGSDDPDNWQTTWEDVEKTVVVDGEARTTTEGEWVTKYTGPTLDALAELTEFRQRADKQDALVAELQARLRDLEGKDDNGRSKRRSKKSDPS